MYGKSAARHQFASGGELDGPWGESKSCTKCGKCVQVCPTGALAEKGLAVEEMTKSMRTSSGLRSNAESC